MKRSRLTRVLLSAAGVTAVFVLSGPSAGTADTAANAPSAQATVRDALGADIGTLSLVQGRSSVLVTARINRLPAGFHGFHVHAVGICDPTTTDPAGAPAPFLTAGGHFNPGNAGHGAHAGDLPPLLVTRGGNATVVVETDRFTVAGLFDADGSAVIVHAGPDNLAHIPTRYTSSTTGLPGPDAATLGTGDAGARAGCGVIRQR